jgi:RNA-directed DNA polymerase
MHHFTVDNLRACFESLDGKKATGVDGVTKAMYGQHLEENLQALHQKLHQRAYRPQPVRRVEIPKDDGSTRPLGIRKRPHMSACSVFRADCNRQRTRRLR